MAGVWKDAGYQAVIFALSIGILLLLLSLVNQPALAGDERTRLRAAETQVVQLRGTNGSLHFTATARR